MGDIGGFGARSAAKSSSKQRRNTVNALATYAGPDWYDYEFYKRAPFFVDQFEPERRRTADQAAMAETNALLDADVLAGRTGMSGSGAHLMRRQSARAGRQEALNEALIKKYLQAFSAARGEAGQAHRGRLSAIAGLPMPMAMPTMGAQAADAGVNALSLWLLSRNNQGG